MKGPQQQNQYKMGGGSGQGSGQGSGSGSLAIVNTLDACERIKEEYNYLLSTNQSLKLELEKLAQDKTEMQRHYVMVVQKKKNIYSSIV
jgi:hypothetical protein